jgi:hypothetical protein
MESLHNYGYVLFVVALFAAAVRLTRSRRSAESQSLRLENPRARLTQKLLALIVLVGASALSAMSTLHMPWLWVAAAVAWLSGLQSVLALVLRSPDQLLVLERVFGVLFSGVAVAIYLVFVR